jgi:hypothetical protein
LKHYQRYGFAVNPFELRKLDLTNKQDRSVWRLVDGFKNFRPLVKYMRERIKVRKPAFVAIKGADKSGQSAIGSVVLRFHRVLSQLPADRYVPITVEAENHNIVDLYKQWSPALYNMIKLNLKLTLNKESEQSFLDARKLMDPETLAWDLQLALRGVYPAFEASPSAGFGSCFECIRKHDVVKAARVIFDTIPTVCVFTIRPSEFDLEWDSFRRNYADIYPIELGALEPKEVQAVVRARWGNTTEVPLDLSVLGQNCAKEKHVVGAVLKTVDRMLEIKTKANPDEQPNDIWPGDARLAFDTKSTNELFYSGIYGED